MQIRTITITILCGMFTLAHSLQYTYAITAPELEMPPSLTIAQIKMTGEEFVRIHNNGEDDIADLSAYRLESFNSTQPLSPGASADSQQLPAGPLIAGTSLLLSAEPKPTCGALIAGKLSVSLSDSSGYLHLVYMSQDENGRLGQESIDELSWSSGTVGDISGVPSATKHPKALYYRIAKDNGFGWQLAEPDTNNQCAINAIITQGTTQQRATADTGVLSPAAVEPPSAVISGSVSNEEAPVGIPAANKGLIAPRLTELLPNPSGTGTDATDEFIELYNANNTGFDLSSYVLQTGATGSRKYVVPAGTVLPANSFTAFSSEATSLTLSNTGAQVSLLDPLGKVLDSTQPYKGAKDGIAWAYAKSKWQWTVQATPGKANIIKAPAAKSTVTKAKPAKQAVKKVTTSAGTYPAQTTAAQASQSGTQVQPIHGAIIALVVAAAVLYGAYEHRSDLAVRIQKCRRKLGIGRGDGGKI